MINVRKILKRPTPGMYMAAVIVVVMVIAILAWAIGTSRETPGKPIYAPASPHAESATPGNTPGETNTPLEGGYVSEDEEPGGIDLTDEELEAIQKELEGRPQYINNKTLAYTYNEAGDTLYMGVDLGGHQSDAIYLNLSTTVSQQGSDVGYYISSSYLWPTYQQAEMDPVVAAAQHDVAILSGYDNIRPATYQDEVRFGAAWSGNSQGEPYQSADLYIRAITLADGELLTVCKARIEYDNTANAYQLTSLTGMDVRATGGITEAERTELLDWAYALVSSGIMPKDGGANNFITKADKTACLTASTVEYTGNRVYFPKLYNTYGRLTTKADFTAKYHDLVAVSLDTGSRGFMTLYFSPQGEGILDWFSDISDLPTWISLNALTSKNLYLAGWDEFEPRSSNEKIFM